jgi:hypothetical protein
MLNCENQVSGLAASATKSKSPDFSGLVRFAGGCPATGVVKGRYNPRGRCYRSARFDSAILRQPKLSRIDRRVQGFAHPGT